MLAKHLGQAAHFIVLMMNVWAGRERIGGARGPGGSWGPRKVEVGGWAEIYASLNL